jgi:ATP-binding cassette subfamily B (MDR/TAP) protein 1
VLFTTGALASADTKVERKAREVLSDASSIAEEALSSVMNVAALGAKDKILDRFKRPIAVASRWGIRRGPLQATIYGNMFFTMQSVYALTLFYGVKLVTDGQVRSGGSVMTFVNSTISKFILADLCIAFCSP